VLAEGGQLLQYAPPAELLAKPESTAVGDFVGADRGIRRLAVTPLRQAMVPGSPAAVKEGGPTVDAAGTLYDALAAMLAGDAMEVVVVEGGKNVGVVTRTSIFEVPEAEAKV
jgi:osmoprotectant transport system ATP-binding protein